MEVKVKSQKKEGKKKQKLNCRLIVKVKNIINLQSLIAQLVWAVEYTDCFSAEG